MVGGVVTMPSTQGVCDAANPPKQKQDPFSGTSGIIGLNYNSMQRPGLPSFMFTIENQLIDRFLSRA